MAYMGTVIPDFPNFFTLYGPNLQPEHGDSLIFVVEMQVNYIMNFIRQMAVWTRPEMQTYYRNERGRIVVNSPHRDVDFFAMTREVCYDADARGGSCGVRHRASPIVRFRRTPCDF
ncbi:MAG: hypothetical protein VB949_16525 [Pseudomonadales bacterium]